MIAEARIREQIPTTPIGVQWFNALVINYLNYLVLTI